MGKSAVLDGRNCMTKNVNFFTYGQFLNVPHVIIQTLVSHQVVNLCMNLKPFFLLPIVHKFPESEGEGVAAYAGDATATIGTTTWGFQ